MAFLRNQFLRKHFKSNSKSGCAVKSSSIFFALDLFNYFEKLIMVLNFYRDRRV